MGIMSLTVLNSEWIHAFAEGSIGCVPQVADWILSIAGVNLFPKFDLFRCTPLLLSVNTTVLFHRGMDPCEIPLIPPRHYG